MAKAGPGRNRSQSAVGLLTEEGSSGGQPPEFPTNFRNKEKQDNNNEEFDPGSG